MNQNFSYISARVSPMTRYKMNQLIDFFQHSSEKKISQKDVLEIAIEALYEEAQAEGQREPLKRKMQKKKEEK